MSETRRLDRDYTKNPCKHCGHSPDDHRFDDDRVNEFAGVPWEDRPFRCLGPEFAGCDQSCPDFGGEPLTFTAALRDGGQ